MDPGPDAGEESTPTLAAVLGSDLLGRVTKRRNAAPRAANVAEAEAAQHAASKEAATGAACRSELLTRPAAEIRPEPIRWLWAGRFALGKLALVVGEPGVGKSLLGVDLAARVSGGAGSPDRGAIAPGRVLLASVEDDPADTIRPRLEAAGADLTRVEIVEGVRGEKGKRRPFCLEDVGALDRKLAERPDTVLVVIDPLGAVIGSATDEHRNNEIRALLTPLADLAARFKVAIVIIHHLRKAAGSALHRTAGSLAFTAAARALFAVAPDSEDERRRLFLHVKGNLAARPPGLAFRIVERDVQTSAGTIQAPRLEWEAGTVNVTADEALGADGLDRGTPSELGEAEAFVREELSTGPVEAQAMFARAKQNGIAGITLKRACKILGVDKSKAAFNGPWLWSLPEESSAEGDQRQGEESMIPFVDLDPLRANRPIEAVPGGVEGVEEGHSHEGDHPLQAGHLCGEETGGPGPDPAPAELPEGLPVEATAP